MSLLKRVEALRMHPGLYQMPVRPHHCKIAVTLYFFATIYSRRDTQ